MSGSLTHGGGKNVRNPQFYVFGKRPVYYALLELKKFDVIFEHSNGVNEIEDMFAYKTHFQKVQEYLPTKLRRQYVFNNIYDLSIT